MIVAEAHPEAGNTGGWPGDHTGHGPETSPSLYWDRMV